MAVAPFPASYPTLGTLARVHIDLITGQARGCPMCQLAYEPSPQVKPAVNSPLDTTHQAGILERTRSKKFVLLSVRS